MEKTTQIQARLQDEPGELSMSGLAQLQQMHSSLQRNHMRLMVGRSGTATCLPYQHQLSKLTLPEITDHIHQEKASFLETGSGCASHHYGHNDKLQKCFRASLEHGKAHQVPEI